MPASVEPPAANAAFTPVEPRRMMPSPGPDGVLPAPTQPPAYAHCQSDFHRRWGALQDVHVRALAWLLDAPDLLDPLAPQWGRRIATLDADIDTAAIWLAALDRDPAPLHAYLNMANVTRLGRYAERLMAFYFGWTGRLVAYGLQVRAAANDTIGEFDFLLREGAALIHYEFATKFYLFESCTASQGADPFVGPNLADTLGAKMDKILNRQLALGRHPAAQSCLPQPIVRAQALVKGWLFYPRATLAAADAPMASGVSPAHCRGFWCSMSEFSDCGPEIGAADAGFLVLPRLAWLAPAQTDTDVILDHVAMRQQLQAHFVGQAMPVMLAVMRRVGQVEQVGQAGQKGQRAQEIARGFIVPDDWRERAMERQQRTVLRIDAG